MSLSRHGVRTYLRERSPTVISAREPLWTDHGLKSGISEWELISTLKKKKKRRQGMNGQIFSQNPHKKCYTKKRRKGLDIFLFLVGWGCSSVGGASDWHTADMGSIPQCSKGSLFQSQLSVQTLLRCPYIPACNHMHLHLCAC